MESKLSDRLSIYGKVTLGDSLMSNNGVLAN